MAGAEIEEQRLKTAAASVSDAFCGKSKRYGDERKIESNGHKSSVFSLKKSNTHKCGSQRTSQSVMYGKQETSSRSMAPIRERPRLLSSKIKRRSYVDSKTVLSQLEGSK